MWVLMYIQVNNVKDYLMEGRYVFAERPYLFFFSSAISVQNVFSCPRPERLISASFLFPLESKLERTELFCKKEKRQGKVADTKDHL